MHEALRMGTLLAELAAAWGATAVVDVGAGAGREGFCACPTPRCACGLRASPSHLGAGYVGHLLRCCCPELRYVGIEGNPAIHAGARQLAVVAEPMAQR